jgi:hypothetical protein
MEITAMKTRTRSLIKVGGLLLLLATMMLVSSPAMADVPAETCTLAGTTRTCDLWAMAGSVTLPDGVTVPIWGFAGSAAGPAQLPGPPIVARQGETLRVILHNELAGETVSLVFPGQLGLQDYTVGAGQGASVVYEFVLDSPGTFLYEAGPTTNGARQVAMGLYGGLVVRPAAAGQAYDDVATAFDFEELLVLSEIDPGLNADPHGFALHEFEPHYRLINGLAYPQTAAIPAEAGATVLLRYVNAGLETHGMSVLGLRQQIVASDGKQVHAYTVTAEKIVSGETMDALLSLPLDAVEGSRFALYDASLMLHNGSQRLADGSLAMGGMMTFVDAVVGVPPSLGGPIVRNVQVSPSPTTGTMGVTLTADVITDAGLSAVEYFTNSVGAPGTGTPMLIGGGAPTHAATVDIPPEVLEGWSSGFVALYVRGQDANGWGLVGAAILNLDKLGPLSTAMSLKPDPSNGTRPVLLRATGDDHSTGSNNVIAATYTIDGVGPLPMTLARMDNPVTAMTATLTITDLGGLAEGLHPIAVVAEDSLGNLGAAGIITLTMDKTGPLASTDASLVPNLLDLSGAPPLTNIRLEATISDALVAGAQSTLVNAEGFIDTIGADGTGFDLFPSDGMFDEITEVVYFDIPVASFLYLAQGPHTIYLHGLDAAGNWGAFGEAILTIDRGAEDLEGPTITALTITINPLRVSTVTISARAGDPGLLSNIAGAEWFVDTDPGEGAGSPLLPYDGVFDTPNELLIATVDVSSWPAGVYTFYARALDSSGFWGPTASATLETQQQGTSLFIYLPIVVSSP